MAKRLTKAERLRMLVVDYVSGPSSGNWLAACEAANLFIDEDDPQAKAALARYEAELAVASADDDAETHSKSEWVQMAERLAPVFEEIARAGTVGGEKATAAQVRAITEINLRAYGRVTMSSSDKAAAAGIVILPALGTPETLRVCPVCLSRIEAENPVATEPRQADSVSSQPS